LSLIRNSPWLAALAAGALDAWAIYVLATGEVKLSKYNPNVATRASDPGAFWVAWLVIAALAFLVSWHAWRLWRRGQ